jgi:hypothetical protein
MVITTKEITRPSLMHDGRKSRYASKPQLVVELKCDQCQVEFGMKISSSFLTKQKHHFCSKECMDDAARSGGTLFEKKKKTCLDHFGYESQNSNPSIKQKKKETFLRTLGVENPFASEEIRSQIRENLLKEYGVEHSSQIPESREKYKQTCLERFGVENPLQHPKIFQQVQKKRKHTTILVHWKTKEELTCTASYEVAFVNWCNENFIDFDWQIPFEMPSGHVYNVDAYIKSGQFRETWIEIKGWKNERSMKKWNWFHLQFPNNSQLWDTDRLIELEIL